jgi:phage-related protein
MKTMNADLIIAKNQLYSEEPWITLLEIEIETGSYLRLAAYPERIIWNNKEFIPFPCVVESVSEESSGRRDTVQVSVANIDRMVSAYVENNTILGKSVSMYIVYRERLDVTEDILAFTFRVNRIETTATTATFQLGHEDLFAMTMGHQRFVRDKCRFAYKDEHCCYPNDEFNASTAINLVPGGDGEKGFGWSIANAANSAPQTYNPDGTLDETGTRIYGGNIELKSKFDAAYSGATAVYAYKSFYGDIDAYTRYVSDPGTQRIAIFKLVDPVTPANWVGIGCEREGGVSYVNAYRSDTGVRLKERLGPTVTYWRIKREGLRIRTYWHGEYDTTWQTGTDWTIAWVPNLIRIGFCAEVTSLVDSKYAQQWDFFRMTEGGLTSCDYTLDGPNGCRQHQNTVNFGGFPSIPYGRLYA